MDPEGSGNALSARDRATLRARAHGLKPVVWVAGSGITPGAMREIDRALTVHELIKIHAALDGRLARTTLLADICVTLGAQAVQVIGKMLIAFRRRPQTVETATAEAAAAPAGRRASKDTPSWQRSARAGPAKPGRRPRFKRT